MAGWSDSVKKFVKWWLPVIMWMGVIFIGSSIGDVPRVGGKTTDGLVHRAAHVLEYAVLGALLLRALSKGRARHAARDAGRADHRGCVRRQRRVPSALHAGAQFRGRVSDVGRGGRCDWRGGVAVVAQQKATAA